MPSNQVVIHLCFKGTCLFLLPLAAWWQPRVSLTFWYILPHYMALHHRRYLPFIRRVKSHQPSAGIIRSILFSTL